jgi:TPR repeat protein
MLRYGFCLENDGDLAAAAKYFKMSTDAGCSCGMTAYGLCLENGRDFVAAARYYKMSADLGDFTGMVNFSTCLQNGRGVDKNVAEAVKYHKMSADVGNFPEITNLAGKYETIAVMPNCTAYLVITVRSSKCRRIWEIPAAWRCMVSCWSMATVLIKMLLLRLSITKCPPTRETQSAC